MNKQKVNNTVKKKEKLNELDGKTWTRYSISIWDIIKTPEENKLKHPAMFPAELCKRLIEIYTKKGDVVLDPFMGSGSAIIMARDMERKGIGFDVNPDFLDLTESRLAQRKIIQLDVEEPDIYCEDATNLLKFVEPNSVDFVLTSPPYWNIHTRKRTADYKKPRPYSGLKRDIGNITDFNEFMIELKSIFQKVHTVLKHGKRCIVIVMDIRQGSRFFPLHMDVSNMMKEIGFVFEDIMIWDRKQEYSNLRPLGYPYVFIVNKIHEYILIFRKKKVEEIEKTLS